MFRPSTKCTLVKGKILPEGVCNHFNMDMRFDINVQMQPVAKGVMMDTMRMFLPITKVDRVNRLVYAIATEEKPDRAGEILDYTKSKPFFEAWSAEVAKASDGKSLGNVRAMHSKVAAGKVTELNFNDPSKRIETCIKVVDQNEWEKVEQGVYTGLSIGGSYKERYPDPQNPSLKRYVADPHEISLVDLPCLPSATFQLIKSIGVVSEAEQHSFQPISNEEGVNEAFEKFYKGEYDKAMFGDEPGDSNDDTGADELAKVGTPEEASRVGPDAHVGAPSGRDDQHKPSSIKDEPPAAVTGGGSSDAAPRTPATARVPNREGEEDEEVTDASLPDDTDTHVGAPGGPIAGAGEGAVHATIPGSGGSATITEGMGKNQDGSGGDPVVQMWLAKDGKPFRKKADAVAWNDELAQAELARNIAAPAQTILDALNTTLDRIDGGGVKISDVNAFDAAWQAAQKAVQTRAGVNPLGKVYHDVKDLPPAVTSHFNDPNKQHQWMDVWNSVYGKSKDEQKAFAEAWAAAEKALTQEEFEKKKAAANAKYGDVKYADPGYQKDGKKRYPLDTEKHVRAAWSYIHMPKNAAKYSANQLAHIKSEITGAWKGVVGSDPPDASKVMGSAFIRLLGENLSKHLYDVGDVACMILRLNDLKTCLEMEAVREGDDMKMAGELEANIATMCEFLRNLVEDETEELMMGTEDLTGWADNPDGDDAAVQIFVRAAVGPNALSLAKIFRETVIKHEDEQVELAKAKGLGYNRGHTIKLVEAMEKVGQKMGQVNRMHLQAAHDHISNMTDGDVCEEGDTEKWTKAGAKLSSATRAKLKTIHDHMSDLGADCSMGKGAYLLSTTTEISEFEKSRGLGGGALSKILDENIAYKRVIPQLTDELKKAVERIGKLEAMPEPPRGLRRAPTGAVLVEKGHEAVDDFSYEGAKGQDALDNFAKYLESLSEEKRALEMIKLAQRSPVVRTTG
jgi:hypothetical protein